jgi:MinD superfamily P-loop ATPase
MKELVVISGKGGTGKTSLVASLATLARDRVVLADCDVDAADLHLVLEPQILETTDFSGGSLAVINADKCIGCMKCQNICRFSAIALNGPANHHVKKTYLVDPIACEGCGVCLQVCPIGAIELKPSINGQWFISETRFGPMVHAKLGIAEENSGKLVCIVRSRAKEIAESQNKELVLIDGSPGIGCPVIASVTGSDLVLIVTEPTVSGLHDLERVAGLTKHFGVATMVCINKWDINESVAREIEQLAVKHNLLFAGRIRYDRAVTQAMIHRKSIIEFTASSLSQDIEAVWITIQKFLFNV